MRYRMAFLRVLTASLFWSGFLATTGLAQGPALTTLEVFPPDISLTTSRARQAFVVKGTYADGITRDVTTQAKVTVAKKSGAGRTPMQCSPRRPARASESCGHGLVDFGVRQHRR